MSRASGSSIIEKSNLVLDVVTSAHRPLGFSEIVKGTGIVKSSCHRILAILQGERLIDFDKHTRTYRSGHRLQTWARVVWNRADIQQAANPHMADLCDQTQMNTALSILDGDSVLYLRTVDFFNARFASHAGDRATLHATAAGKLCLAHMSPARLDAHLGQMSFDVFTRYTIQTATEMRAQCDIIRETGFAIADREEALQVTGIAAPIWNEEGKHVASLSLWSTFQRHETAAVVDQSDMLIEVAKNISAEIGAVAPETNE
jgi:DNA-binding IclR family transcriptional regulator